MLSYIARQRDDIFVFAVGCLITLFAFSPVLRAADMHQDMDMRGNSVTNAKYYGDGAGLTNLPSVTESDPVWMSQKSGYATGMPVYVESDPMWSSASNSYLEKDAAASMYATGTPVYVESDPLWSDSFIERRRLIQGFQPARLFMWNPTRYGLQPAILT